MAYQKQTWTDRNVETPRTYTMVENQDGTVTLIPAPGTVTAEGTPVSAARMNHIEDGIDGAVCKSGDTMTGSLMAQGFLVKAETYQFYNMLDENGNATGHMRAEKDGNSNNRIVFRANSASANIEDFRLPVADGNANVGYEILTTKSPVTVAQGGTNATTPLQAIRNLGGMAELGYVDVNFLNDMTVSYNYSAVFVNDLSTNNHIDIPVSSWFYVQHYSKSDGDGWAHQVFYEMGGSARIFHRISTHDTWYNSIEIPNALPIPISQGGTGVNGVEESQISINPDLAALGLNVSLRDNNTAAAKIRRWGKLYTMQYDAVLSQSTYTGATSWQELIVDNKGWLSSQAANMPYVAWANSDYQLIHGIGLWCENGRTYGVSFMSVNLTWIDPN